MLEAQTLTNEERVDKLWRLYDALLLHLLDAFAAEERPSASLVDTARRFLNDNAINLSTRPDLRRGLAAMADLRGLPFKVD
jgi:hypothetical protein